MLDGIIDRIREQFPGKEVSVVATGGNAPVIVRYCRNPIVYDKYLLMDGLWGHLPEEQVEKNRNK